MYQKIIIVGNLGSDPEMRYMPDGTAVTSFSLASNRRWTNPQGQPVEETTWFRVSIWRKSAEVANQYLTKGSKILVEGRLKPDPNTGAPRLWTRQDGSVAASYEVTADNFLMLSSRQEDGSGGGRSSASSGGGSYGGGQPFDGPPSAIEEDDIPF